MTAAADRFAVLLAARLAAIVPDGFHVTLEGDMLWFRSDEGRFPGQQGDYQTGSVGTWPQEDFLLYLEHDQGTAADGAANAARHALDTLQDYVAEATHDPWPGQRTMPEPHAEVKDAALHLWYGPPDDVVLACEPIPLTAFVGGWARCPMNHWPAVRRFQAGDAPAAAAIFRGLPDYFTPDVPAKAERDAARHQAWVITDAGTIAGIAIAARKSTAGAEILWIAIDPARRGRGHGTTLLGHVLACLADAGIAVVEAKTLDRSSGYRPYEATRAFWERSGFIHIDTIDPLPGWPPGNPAAIYVAALRPTR